MSTPPKKDEDKKVDKKVDKKDDKKDEKKDEESPTDKPSSSDTGNECKFAKCTNYKYQTNPNTTESLLTAPSSSGMQATTSTVSGSSIESGLTMSSSQQQQQQSPSTDEELLDPVMANIFKKCGKNYKSQSNSAEQTATSSKVSKEASGTLATTSGVSFDQSSSSLTDISQLPSGISLSSMPSSVASHPQSGIVSPLAKSSISSSKGHSNHSSEHSDSHVKSQLSEIKSLDESSIPDQTPPPPPQPVQSTTPGIQPILYRQDTLDDLIITLDMDPNPTLAGLGNIPDRPVTSASGYPVVHAPTHSPQIPRSSSEPLVDQPLQAPQSEESNKTPVPQEEEEGSSQLESKSKNDDNQDQS